MKILVSQNKTEEAKKLLPKVYKVLDKSAKVGLIKKNTASRKKARISKSINKSSK
jgi:small subunit ribosomal protein S20